MSYSKEEVKEQLELEDVYALLEYFDAEPEMFDDYIVARTVCHGGDSKKLYYYENTQLLHCFTQCQPSTFDIFELVQKIKHLDDLNAAIYFVVNFFNLQHQISEVDEDYSTEDWKLFSRYEKTSGFSGNNNKVVLPEFDLNILKYYPRPKILNWEREGISKEICDYTGICYDPVGGNILIPHYDENNRAVGIRQRTLIQENESKYGKYKPWRHGKQLFNHPLAFNLYGLNWAKDNIKNMEIAIVVESEKSVLKFLSYFGTKNNICVAVCGSSISKYQINLLLETGAKEIIVAFDKDFEETGSEDYWKVVKKLEGINKKFSSLCNISFLFDKENNMLGYKDSPLDCGPDKFLYLFRNRVII